MAMFLSRIKKALNLGTKNITVNGTYNASSDGYDGYSSVEVNVAGVTPTPITPSNASPAALTSGSAVTPTANGYAIESYSSVTPSNSSPVTLTSGDVVKLGGNGYAIESYTVKSPNNSTPVALISGEIDKINGNGYAIESYSSITPSNSSPATITSGSIYKASANGKAVASVTDVIPSSTPTSLSYGDIIQTLGSGVIVDSITSITPSNSSPVALTADTPVNPTDSGYAIASYEEIDVPRTSHHYTIRPDMPTISRVGALEGVEQLHFHSLDPSNSDPDTITYGEIYRADRSGVAVASVTGVMPSSTPTSVSMDDIVHIYGSGVIVDSIPTPTSITPSNSSPVALTADTPVNPTESGYAIKSYSEVAPSNANPPDMYSGSIYKIKTRNGLLISTASLVSPSDTNPPQLLVNDTYYRINGASGYLYSTVQPKVKTGTISMSTSTTNKVTLGWKPKYLCAYSTSAYYSNIWIDTMASNKYIRSTSSGPIMASWNANYSGGLVSIDNDGFTLRASTSSGGITYQYFAIG